MNITLNGANAEVPDGTSVEGLLMQSGYERSRRGVAIAVNGEVVPRGSWVHHPVVEGDVVELLTASQGG